MSYVAFLDTTALVPHVLCDLLLRLAERDLFRPAWSPHVLAELEQVLVRLHPQMAGKRVQRRRQAMESYFPHAMTTGYEDLIPVMAVERDDRHVAAAAVRARADVLVTANLRDFPEHWSVAYDIPVEHPDDFLLDQLSLDPEAVVAEILDQAGSRKRPPLTIDEHIASLERHVPKFVAHLRPQLPPPLAG